MGALQLPGRGSRLGELQVRRLVPLSRMVAQELMPYLDKPYVFFGHNLGGLLCFETARRLLHDYRREPRHLFVSATEAPHRRSHQELISCLPKSAFVKKLHEFNGTPAEVLLNDELLNLMLPTIRADFELYETYEYHPSLPLECPMTIYGGLEDPVVEAGSLAAWSDMTVGAVRCECFPVIIFISTAPKRSFCKPSRAICLDYVCEIELHMPITIYGQRSEKLNEAP